MKEMDRIAIKKIERIADAEYKAYLDSLSDEMREEYLGKISARIKRDVRINSFDSYITRHYESMKGCPHEYAICNGRDTFAGKECLCLDCGEYIDRSEAKEVIFSSVDDRLEDIRRKYVEYLMDNSVCDAYVKTFEYFSKKSSLLK